MIMSTDIDTSLYDRQIRTYGVEALKKITSSSVTIIGLENGLSTEIAKNLALGGIKEINLYDNEKITNDNLETGFYYSVNDVGLVRSVVLSRRVQELNPYVTVTSIQSLDKVKNDSVIIVVNKSSDEVKYYEQTFNSRMIAVFSKGTAGMVFINAGDEHIVNDVMGENIEPVQIGSIDKTGKIQCAPNHSHDFQSGDFIRFENLQGENSCRLENLEFKIKVISPTCFVLDDYSFVDVKINNGTAILIKKPVKISHKKFSEQLSNPTFNMSFDDSKNIFDSLLTYFDNRKDFENKELWSEEHNSLLIKKLEKNSELGRTFNCEFLPVYSLIGSVTASETIKIITNKYMPVNQFWCWYEPNMIPTQKPTKVGSTSIGKLYGVDFEEQMKKSSWFVVGSGAIGCELLKNLAYMNVSQSDEGKIYLTDPDNIEKSNLNRQFLFRSYHIGKPKSKMATESINQMRKLNIIPLTEKVCKENQEFTNKIMKEVTGVFNALDNIHARRYMDEQCFHKIKPLFESGTTGTKGNTQSVIPFLTETYSNSADPPQEKSFPICTIKNFPNEIQHTIHWAMDFFELFNRAPKNINKWIKDKLVFESCISVENSQGKEDVLSFLIKQKINTFDDCVYRAVEMFYQNYKNQIKQLLTTYPQDHKTEDGNLFWSNGKRAPKSIENLDVENEYHMDYIEATSHILARIFQINDNYDRHQIKQMCSECKYSDDFKPNDKLKIATKDSEIKTEIIDIVLPDNKEYSNLELKSEEFEKDDTTNWHVSFVNAASNLRAINYGIPPASYQETKGIAGRIIPAIATTTSVVSGLIVLEMFKYMLSKSDIIENKIEKYRSTFVNLADTTLVYSEPMPAGEIEIAGRKFNNWVKFEYHEDCSLNEFKIHFEKMFKTTITMMVYDNGILYADFMSDDETLSKKLSELIYEKTPEVDLKNPVLISMASSDDQELPEIHFSL